MKDTIVAISTTLGMSAIGVVRLSGENALEIVKQITKKNTFNPRYAHLCGIYDGEDLLDEALVIYFPAPKSYTCEDLCEIQCHGGVVLPRAILQLCLRYGARIANAGEFTKRAFLNGRIDFSQAEAVAQLIQAQSIQSSKFLMRQLRGSLSQFVERCRKDLIESLAFSEVMIDYSEEDIPGDISHHLLKKIEILRADLEKTLCFSQMRDGILQGMSLCIIGKPNVGKSSLLNALLLEDRAIVSEQAGTTRDTIESYINIDGHMVRIIDTAGIRESRDGIEKEGIDRSLKALEGSDIILAVFDRSSELDHEDEQIFSYLEQHKTKDKIIILNKSDLSAKISKDSFFSFSTEVIELTTKTSEDILNLREKIGRVIEKKPLPQGDFLLGSYQIEAVKQAVVAVDQALLRWQSGELELFSYHIKEAIDSISLLVRPYEVDEMLDEMFGKFCLGK